MGTFAVNLDEIGFGVLWIQKYYLQSQIYKAYKLQRLVCIHPSVDTQTLKHYMKLAFHPKYKTLTICSTVLAGMDNFDNVRFLNHDCHLC